MVAEILWFFVFRFSFLKLVNFADFCSCDKLLMVCDPVDQFMLVLAGNENN